MEKKRKIISIIMILTVLIYYSFSILLQHKAFAVTQSVSTDIDNIDESKYPGIKEKIKQFEKDVALGKNVDIKDYTTEDNINYETKVSKAGLNISKNLGEVVKTGIEGTFSFLNDLIEG